MTPLKIGEDVREWAIDHQARSESRWDAQHKHNEDTDDAMKTLSSRLTSVEQRVIWLVALAAAGGGLTGQALFSLLPI